MALITLNPTVQEFIQAYGLTTEVVAANVVTFSNSRTDLEFVFSSIGLCGINLYGVPQTNRNDRPSGAFEASIHGGKITYVKTQTWEARKSTKLGAEFRGMVKAVVAAGQA